ncbi:MAG: SIR2 family protein [Campylobacterota bacterium]
MENLLEQIKSDEIVLFIGIGVFKGLTNSQNQPLPYDSDSFILSINDGKPLPQRLMYEYSRACMNIEQKKGRAYLENLIENIYKNPYPTPKIYDLVAQIKPKYIIDTNIDDSLQKAYADTPHFLILGTSRVIGYDDRFEVYEYDGISYKPSTKDSLDSSKPILFKPMGSLTPKKSLIVSDADFVDWLTEAMGGYAIPPYLKEYRKNKSYVFVGVDFNKDTFRMVANEIILGGAGGYVVYEKDELSKKEKKFFENQKLTQIKEAL